MLARGLHVLAWFWVVMALLSVVRMVYWLLQNTVTAAIEGITSFVFSVVCMTLAAVFFSLHGWSKPSGYAFFRRLAFNREQEAARRIAEERSKPPTV
jgi:hypothetical protein